MTHDADSAIDHISMADRLAFRTFSQKIAGHAAGHHTMFETMCAQAHQGTLTSEQVDLFTRAMMARIFRTIPTIAGLVQTALVKGDAELAQTAMQNLTEEMGQGGKSHQQLAEEAFNALRKAYGLPSLTLKDAHDAAPLPESYVQEQLWLSGYHDFPAIASWLQESASGGISDNCKGMMADLFTVFEACREKVGDHVFRESVLPYFAAHNRIEQQGGHYRVVFDQEAVECQHGLRAKGDAEREYCVLPKHERQRIETMAEAFLKVQEDLFGAIQKGVTAGGLGR